MVHDLDHVIFAIATRRVFELLEELPAVKLLANEEYMTVILVNFFQFDHTWMVQNAHDVQFFYQGLLNMKNILFTLSSLTSFNLSFSKALAANCFPDLRLVALYTLAKLP
jgi:hypothetical protein